MKRSRFTEEQIIGILKGIRPMSVRLQAFSACQFHGISSSTRLIL